LPGSKRTSSHRSPPIFSTNGFLKDSTALIDASVFWPRMAAFS
jgi:hypothetical protein